MRGILKKVFPSLVWYFSSQEKVIYLTFDDGPHPELTPFILKELEKYNAKATFFLLGKEAETHSHLVSELLKQKHSIGNHTFSHLNGWSTKNDDYFEDIEKCDSILKSKLFRPPYGRIKPSQIRRLKKDYKIVMWDVLSWDFNQSLSEDKCFERVIRKIKNGSIIVFHENNKSLRNMKYCVPKLLQHFTDLGYQFKSISAD